jgi:hypothetical protein
MPMRRGGFSDSLNDSRLAWLTGTSFPAAPAGLYIALCRGVPLSDGSGVAAEEVVRIGPIVYGSPSSGSGDGGWPESRVIVPTSAVSFTPPGPVSPVSYAAGSGWALYGVSSGGVPLYAGVYSWRLQVGVAQVLPAATFAIAAD